MLCERSKGVAGLHSDAERYYDNQAGAMSKQPLVNIRDPLKVKVKG
jgi:hypothetical protein